MAESALTSLFSLWSKLQERLAAGASSSRPYVVPNLKKLNDMVYEVYNPPLEEKPQLEVVFFHGLQIRHCKEAYFTSCMSQDNSQFWLQTWLVELFPKARILTVSYDSSAERTHEFGRLDMYCTGENLVSSLTANEVGVGQMGCPVVLVGHCLGGLVLKELCLSGGWMLGRKDGERPGVERINSLFSNLRGMFFYGTPHTGLLLSDKWHNCFKGALLEEMETLKASSARRNEEFNDLKTRYEWLTFGMGKSKKTTWYEFLKEYILMVPEASSRPYMDSYYSVAKDHYDICKPNGKKDTTLTCLTNFLNKIQNDGVLQAGVVADAKSNREYVIDLEGRAKVVHYLLAEPNRHTIFITGLSGIGKTTLAQQVFFDIAHNFAITCFVSLDPIEASTNGREKVLKKVQEALGGIDRGASHNHLSVFHQLKRKRVVMVLDNVESEGQLDDLQTRTWLEGSASKLIVITTNSRLGKPSNTFEVPYLSDKESSQLFSHYAFQGGEGPKELGYIIRRVVRNCENFPLLLKIIGCYVSKEDVHEKQLWLDLLDRLEKAQEVDGGHDYRMWAKLRLCYDALEPSEKEIFLDIATMFQGFPLSLMRCIWKGCRDSPHLAWINLSRRFLVYEDINGRVQMHGQLRNLGQSIACPPNTSIDKWKRVSGSSLAKQLISEYQGTVDTLALKLQIAENESLKLRNTTFLNYIHLQYLILEGVSTSWGKAKLPRSLVYLRWKDGLFTRCPVDFTRLEKLVVLELIDCKSMKSLSHGLAMASNLTWLELEGCQSLTDLPIGLSKCLEHLGLKGTRLRKLPRDLGKFKVLRRLQASQTKLARVPQGLVCLEMLSLLDLTGTRVTTLPESIGDLKCLTELNLRETMLSSLPESIGQLQELEKLNLRFTAVKSLPQSIGNLVKLEYLYLRNTPLEAVPNSICELHSLEFLELENTQISTLPDSIGELVGLKTLHVRSPRLSRLPETLRMLSSLESFNVDIQYGQESVQYSVEPEEVRCEGEENAQTAERDRQLRVYSFLPQFFGVYTLLSQLPSLQRVTWLDLYGKGYEQCWLPALFRALQQLPNLTYLKLIDFNLAETTPCELGMLTSLKSLDIKGWERLLELPESLGNLRKLTNLTLEENPRLCTLPEALSSLPLKNLTVLNCGSLQSMPCSFSHGSSSTKLKLRGVYSDSWKVVECFLECCGKHFSGNIEYFVECKDLKKALKKSIKADKKKYLLDTKVLSETFLHFCGGYNVRVEASSLSTSHCTRQHYTPHQAFKLGCRKKCGAEGHRQGVEVIDQQGKTHQMIDPTVCVKDPQEEFRDWMEVINKYFPSFSN